MAVADLLARSSQGDIVQDGYVVTDDTGLADDNAGCVIEHQAVSQHCGRMDVDIEHLGDLALEEQRKLPAVKLPETVRDAVGLNCMESLEIKKRGAVKLDGRITRNNRLNVHAGRIDQLIAAAVGKVEDVPEVHRGDDRAAKLVCEDKHQGRSEIRVVQYGRMQKTGKHRLPGGHFGGLFSDPLPNLSAAANHTYLDIAHAPAIPDETTAVLLFDAVAAER